MIIEKKSVFFVFWFTCLLKMVSCDSQAPDYALSHDITKYTVHSLDIRSIVGSEYKIVGTIIKQGQLLVKAVKFDSAFFIAINLVSGKVLFNKPDPTNDIFTSTFDINNESVISLSPLKASDIHITNIKTNEVVKKIVAFERATQPGTLISNEGQIFLLNDVWGVGVIKQSDYSKIHFHNEVEIGNPQSCTMSLPVDDSLNLLSGHVIDNNTIQLYAIDDLNNIRWKYIIKQDSWQDAVAILNYENLFVLKYDSAVVALDKENGKVVWRKVLKDAINGIYQWENNVLVYSLINDKGIYPDKEGFEYRVELKLFNCSQGKEVWSKKLTSVDKICLGICDSVLLLSDDKAFSVFSLSNGALNERTSFSEDAKEKYAFDLLSDLETGEYYLWSYDGKIYW